MALIKDSLWGIVSGTDEAPPEEQADARKKYMTRRDRALAIIVLAVDPSLLYLLREPEDPRAVWRKLEVQFQRRTWSNKLQLRRKLYGLKLKEGGSVNEHIKTMSEIFEELAVIGDAISEEDRVVHLLASLPDSYNVLVTALEAQSENMPSWSLVTERLLHQESKLKEKVSDLFHPSLFLSSWPLLFYTQGVFELDFISFFIYSNNFPEILVRSLKLVLTSYM